jgi:hypothetical protein
VDKDNLGLAFLGDKGSRGFISEIGATKIYPTDRSGSGPDLPLQLQTYAGTVRWFPGLVMRAKEALDAGDFYGLDRYVGVMEEISQFVRANNNWQNTDLP